MDKYDKGKLKVLIKMVLIVNSPKFLTSNQICGVINNYDWGFRTDITSSVVGKLLGYELRSKKGRKHFLDCIETKKRNKITAYRFKPS